MADLPEIHAGFPSPAADYMSGVIDLNRELVRHPEATFFGRVVGDSMADADVHDLANVPVTPPLQNHGDGERHGDDCVDEHQTHDILTVHDNLHVITP